MRRMTRFGLGAAWLVILALHLDAARLERESPQSAGIQSTTTFALHIQRYETLDELLSPDSPLKSLPSIKNKLESRTIRPQSHRPQGRISV